MRSKHSIFMGISVILFLFGTVILPFTNNTSGHSNIDHPFESLLKAHATEPPPPECVKNRDNPDSIAWKYNHAMCELDLYRDENTGKVNEDYIPRYLHAEITRIWGDEWEGTDRSWNNFADDFDYPDIICSEIMYDGMMYTVTLDMPDEYTLRNIGLHNPDHEPEGEFDVSDCHKYYPSVNDMQLRDSPSTLQNLSEKAACGAGTTFRDGICVVDNLVGVHDGMDDGSWAYFVVFGLFVIIGIISILLYNKSKKHP